MDRFKYRAYDETYKRFLYRTLIEPKEASLNWEQCTGLKDKNGKLIYENDKIKDWKNNRFVIAFDGQYAQFVAKDENGWVSPIERDVLEDCEIIGNIHENADLLGEE